MIDGQQRLTTIVLTLCSLRELLSNCDKNQNQSEYLKIINEWLYRFDMNSGDYEIRLELQYDESKDYLNKLILKESYEGDKSPSILKMEEAYECIHEHLQFYKEKGVDSLISFTRYFLTQVELVVIKSENLSSALKIFETINQRGVGLNAMDLVKNLLFSEAKDNDFQSIKDIWKEINLNLQACNEDQNPLRFLRYFIMARYHNKILREDDIYKWIISKEGKRSTQYEADPLRLAKELAKISKRYSDLIIATEYMRDGSIYPNISNIGFINKYKSRQHLILLLSLNINVEDSVIEYLAEQIESFFFYSNSLGIQAKNNERLFVQWADKIRGIKTIDKLSSVLADTMVAYIKGKIGPFKSRFLNISQYSYNPQYRQRYILGKLENTILRKSNLPIHGHDFLQGMQIEHILPQTPRGGYIPAEYIDEDEFYTYVYRLGNITLLEGMINQAVNHCNDLESEDWFKDKQKEYNHSKIYMACLLDNDYSIGANTAINRFKDASGYQFESWSKESIDKRQAVLLELVFETWKFNNCRIDR